MNVAPTDFDILQAGFDAALDSAAWPAPDGGLTREQRVLWQAGYKGGRESVNLLTADMDEHDHQVMLFRWAQTMAAVEPRLALMYAIPNAGKRTAFTAARMKEEGLKPGVPDLCLPLPRYGCGALYIEMKSRETNGRVSKDQRWWLDELRAAGNQSQVCYSWLEARQAVRDYLSGVRHA